MFKKFFAEDQFNTSYENPFRYLSVICRIPFQKKPILGDRPYKCNHCSADFVYKHNLQRHELCNFGLLYLKGSKLFLSKIGCCIRSSLLEPNIASC